ncbi:protein Dr1 [Eurytemora carolleeae]|uniref:protein Dr1 n=1 Tax=Eurytemora carolleeae TaxID=1294199 RepID=UPI000C75B98A|nr:protein Dr1 [Eurytemora carolleeae]|eukprot:XP_023337999.1 protein Dr1-like [Eurytemora affinis]
MEDGGGPSWSPDNTRSQNQDQEDELTIPRAAMNKMIKEILPNIRVANEARELVLSCCTEFIHLVSSESNEVCNQQQKKTISAEHVFAALHKLGFGDFVKEAEEVLSECKESAAKRRRQSTRLENLGIPEEELLRQQQELFAKAREAEVMKEQAQLAAVGQAAQFAAVSSGAEDYS